MGGGVPRGGPPNQTAYYVALVSIVFLIILLCCYFCYFFISKIRELSQQDTPTATPSTNQPRPASYPVQPVIRDSATAMAALCKQVPPATGRGGTVFPTSTSPAALQTDTGGGEVQPAIPPQLAPPPLGQDKVPVPQPAPAGTEVEASDLFCGYCIKSSS